jgi:hypothetical protein
MNQCERILKYLDEHGSITRAEAMSECGIANFTARVSDLRRDGVALDVETVDTEEPLRRYRAVCEI